ncbi:hypothetical protein Acidovoranil_33340 [Acidovorax sp. FG27]
MRAILMNGQELDSLRTKQMALRMNADARVALAQLMRVEQHQATTINWLIGADHSPLETTIGYEQTAIEVTAAVAQMEPDPYLAQGYRYALLEDFDHLYRYSAMLDRLEGKDPNNITQGYTDIVPARPTWLHHRAPEHDLLEPYGADAELATKLHALTLTGGEYQTHDYYMNIGPLFADPLARQLYAEIASVESQHITHYGSMLNPHETLLEKLLVSEASEVWNYAGCAAQETNPASARCGSAFSTMSSATCRSPCSSSRTSSGATRPRCWATAGCRASSSSAASATSCAAWRRKKAPCARTAPCSCRRPKRAPRRWPTATR